MSTFSLLVPQDHKGFDTMLDFSMVRRNGFERGLGGEEERDLGVTSLGEV
ncbi:hypothetical protein SLEP1_g46053 [Rubroshorea leprosula]|uniref:Uncharacterized protein n=1 Tax=Rubroshorea leprosula TaxID=152421 RepID=A0AAV5LND5_9ROSI|nr:hypothetical protein SLEP1_g46053 [Rubroshorea leprosula]